MSEIVNQLKEKYNARLEREEYKGKPDMSPTIYLFQKWAYKVEKGWYGFDLGWAPFTWGLILSDFLEDLEKRCPDFKICQIKLKFGGLRFYVDLDKCITDRQSIEAKKIREDISALEDWLHHDKLIY